MSSENLMLRSQSEKKKQEQQQDTQKMENGLWF